MVRVRGVLLGKLVLPSGIASRRVSGSSARTRISVLGFIATLLDIELQDLSN